MPEDQTPQQNENIAQFDPTAAFFCGIGSVWGKLLLFFLAVFLGYAVGHLSSEIRDAPLRCDFEWESLPWVPLQVLWQVLVNFLHPLGLLYVALLGVSLCLLLWSNLSPVFVCAIATVLQAWDTFLIQRFVQTSFYDDGSVWGYWAVGGFTVLAAAAVYWLVVLPNRR